MRIRNGDDRARRLLWSVAALALFAAGLTLARRRPDLSVRWRAEWTAKQLAHSLHTADTETLARLSSRGDGHNFLCARRLWATTYWSHDSGPLKLYYLGRDGGDLRYRAVGERLVGDTGRAAFDFFIVPERPDKVERFMAVHGVPTGTAAFRTCVHP